MNSQISIYRQYSQQSLNITWPSTICWQYRDKWHSSKINRFTIQDRDLQNYILAKKIIMCKYECSMDIQSKLEGEDRIKRGFPKDITSGLSSER